MAWISHPMTSDCENYYTKVRKFTLVKESPRGIRIRLENHPEKISIWMSKKITRDYTGTSAWFWSEALYGQVQEEEQKLRDRKEKMENYFEKFNAIHVIKPTNRDIKKIEKIIDSEEEKRCRGG